MQPTSKRISHFLASGRDRQLKQYATQHHAADVAAAITRLRPEDILKVIETVGNSMAFEIFGHLEPDTQKACLEFAEAGRVIHFFEALSADEQADLLKSLDDERKEKLLNLLKASEREDLMRLVKFEEGTAGSAMTTEFFALNPQTSVAEALDYIKKQSEKAETIYILYIIDETDKLVGVASLKDLVLAKPETTLRQIMNPNVISVPVMEDVENVARKIAKYDLLAMPVVNSQRQLRGIITVDDVIDIIEEEVTEDIYAMGAAGSPIDYMGSSVFNISRQRITWLFILVLSGFVAGWVLELFEAELNEIVPLAFFIPLLMGSGGNAGTQASTVIVRGLATGELTTGIFLQVVWKEMRVGLMVGLLMGMFAAFRAYFVGGADASEGLKLAMTVGSAMIIVVTLAKSLGAVLPMFFKRLNLDPALMSGPLVASLIDIFTLVTYLSLAKMYFGI